MPKEIRLTYKGKNGHIFVEECLLISEDEPVYTLDGDLMEGMNLLLGDSERVIFEDEKGLFGLLPERVVNIEVL